MTNASTDKRPTIVSIHSTPGMQYDVASGGIGFCVPYEVSNQKPVNLKFFALAAGGCPIASTPCAIRIYAKSDLNNAVETLEIASKEKSAQFTLPDKYRDDLCDYVLVVTMWNPEDTNENVSIEIQFVPFGLEELAAEEDEDTGVNPGGKLADTVASLAIQIPELATQFGEIKRLCDGMDTELQQVSGKTADLPKTLHSIGLQLELVTNEARRLNQLPNDIASRIAQVVADAINPLKNEMSAMRTTLEALAKMPRATSAGVKPPAKTDDKTEKVKISGKRLVWRIAVVLAVGAGLITLILRF